MELTLAQALQKGVEAHKSGKAQEADRYYTAILKANPKHPDANHNMGVLAVGVGKVQEALPFFKVALDANPKIAQFWLSYIDALIKLDRMADAKLVFEEAITKGAKGDGFDQIEKRLGLLNSAVSNVQEPPSHQLKNLINLYTQGLYREALTKASPLLKQFPNSINLYNIIGAANQNLGKLEEAIEAYNEALYIKPSNSEAYYNMGLALQKQGKQDEAIEAYNNALSLKPDFAEAYHNMSSALEGIIFNKPNRDFQKTITSILEIKLHARPNAIVRAGISLLKFEPNLTKNLKLTDEELIENFLDIISDLSELSLLIKLMMLSPLADLELEKLLKSLRRSILLNIQNIKDASSELLRFQSALALQCFTNEYIYNDTDEEKKAIRALEKIVKDTLKNKEQPTPQAVLALASYKALNQYCWYNLLVVTDHIKEVFCRQVEEPNQEEKLKQDIPVLEEITNSISLKVREQYEENPYPRWINLRLALSSAPIAKVADEIKLKLYDNKITEVEKPVILVAGCGTGQHSLETKSRFESSTVLAIDLSLSSLAYAKRKTQELAIKNIEYMQADILDLGKLNKQFDIIESVGVLHHMNNPMEGWKVLTDCLKPSGLMCIGLYSEIARQSIVKIRDEISKLGIGSSTAEIKSFREIMLNSDNVHHKQIFNFPDFYSLSELRDAIFHFREHRFTIAQLKEDLDSLGLSFCGFGSEKIVSHFKEIYKREDPYDLDKWQAYEEANPRAFTGMYQFWCQKVD